MIKVLNATASIACACSIAVASSVAQEHVPADLFTQIADRASDIPQSWSISGFRPGMTEAEFAAAAEQIGAAIPGTGQSRFTVVSADNLYIVDVEFEEGRAERIILKRGFPAGVQIDPNSLKAEVLSRFGTPVTDGDTSMMFKLSGIKSLEAKAACYEEFRTRGGNNLKADQVSAGFFVGSKINHDTLAAVASLCPGRMDMMTEYAAATLGPDVRVMLPRPGSAKLEAHMHYYGASAIPAAQRRQEDKLRRERELEAQRSLPKARL